MNEKDDTNKNEVEVMDLRKVAELAVEETEAEDMTLQEHDLRYHDNHYRGGPCKYRDNLASGDDSDEAMAEANEQEGAMLNAYKLEERTLEGAMKQPFNINVRAHRSFRLEQPDQNGVWQAAIWCRGDESDDSIDRDKMAKILKDHGYTMNNFFTMMPESDPSMPRKSKTKVFVAEMTKDVPIVMAGNNNADYVTIRREGGGELDDEARSRSLKRFGYKSQDGQVKRRTSDDDAMERIRRYLNLTGDWEGQSNREDLESGRWDEEKRGGDERKRNAMRDALRG